MKTKAGILIKELREKAELSQQDLADDLGYTSRQYVCDWEKNRSSVPLGKIKHLADILGVKPRNLLLICYPELKDIIDQ